MKEFLLGSWTIKVSSSNYSIWSDGANKAMIIELDLKKIAVISLDKNNNIIINSTNALCEIDKEKNQITVCSSDEQRKGTIYS